MQRMIGFTTLFLFVMLSIYSLDYVGYFGHQNKKLLPAKQVSMLLELYE